jgi:hypothetical protein
VPEFKVIFVPDMLKLVPVIATPKVTVDAPKLIVRGNEPVDKKIPQLMA